MAEDEADLPWYPGLFARSLEDDLPIPARLVDEVVIARPEVGAFRVTRAWPDIPADARPYAAIVFDGGAFHYFHLMESVAWLWTLQHEFLDGRAPERLILSVSWDDPRQHGIGRRLLAALYPNTELLDPDSALPSSLDRVLILHRSWAVGRVDKYLEAAMSFAGPHLRGMGQAARLATGAAQHSARGRRILYATRPPPRRVEPEAEAALLVALARLGPCTVVDFGALTWAEQVRAAAATDVMVSVHSNGLTNAWWMRPGGLVVELFPPGMRAYDYQFIAELCGLAYVGFEGGRVFHAGDRTPQYYRGHAHNMPLPQVPQQDILDEISRFFAIEDAL